MSENIAQSENHVQLSIPETTNLILEALKNCRSLVTHRTCFPLDNANVKFIERYLKVSQVVAEAQSALNGHLKLFERIGCGPEKLITCGKMRLSAHDACLHAAKAIHDHVSPMRGDKWKDPYKLEDYLGLVRCVEYESVLAIERNEKNTIEYQKAIGSQNEFKPSPDYASCIWKGEKFVFTNYQAAVVKCLHEACLDKTLVVGDEHLIAQSGSCSSRLRDLFRRKSSGETNFHPAWGTLIIEVTKGRRRLNIE